MKIPVRGPGRPRKWKGPTDIITLRLPLEAIEVIDNLASETGKSRTEVVVALIKAASNVQVAKLLLRIGSLEESIKQLEKEKQVLLEELDKKDAIIEKLQLKLKAAMKGVSSISKDAEKFKLIAEKIEEGKTWKQVCIEVGVRDGAKMRDLLKLAFNIYDNDGKVAKIFSPKDTVPEFQGWSLVKGETRQLADYVFVPKGQEKAFLLERKAKEKMQDKKEAFKVKDPSAEIISTLKVWYSTYNAFMGRRNEKKAQEFLESVMVNGLPRLVEKYGEETVSDVVYSEHRFVEVFAPLLESLIRSKKKEVLANE